MESESYIHAIINYYCREHLYCHMKEAAQNGLKRFNGDPVMKYYVALACILQGQAQEGMSMLDELTDRNETCVGALLALIHAHKKYSNVDEEAVQVLESTLREQRKRANEVALSYAALFLIYIGKPEKGKEYVDRALKANHRCREALTTKGWIELSTSQAEDSQSKRIVKYFEDALALDQLQKNLDALFGKCKYFLMKMNFSGALEMMNQAVVAYPEFAGCLVEKMKIQLALQDWEQSLEVSHRALTVDENCLEALLHQCVHCLAIEGKYDDGVRLASDILMMIDRTEPSNADLYYYCASLLACLSNRNAEVVQVACDMMDKALHIQPDNAQFLTEIGFEKIMMQRHKDAMRLYKNALKVDETSIEALSGIIHVQLLDGQLDEAENQLDFLKEIQQSVGFTPKLLYLQAMLVRRREQPLEKAIKYLDEAMDTHLAHLGRITPGIGYFKALDPCFMIDLAKEYISNGPSVPQTSRKINELILKKANKLLTLLTKHVHGHTEGLFLLAKTKYLGSDFEAANNVLNKCLQFNEAESEAYLLQAEINIQKGSWLQAQHCLEKALSHNFTIREHPLYHLYMARLLKQTGKIEEAIQTLKTASQLPGIKTATGENRNAAMQVYLELADSYMQCDKTEEAGKIMAHCQQLFQGTDAEIKITLANADLALQRGDIQNALGMLKKIPQGESSYFKAREKMADIYLNHMNDPRMYAYTYRELVEKNPTPESYLMLGDAYMSIQEPEKAIEVYEAALKKNPRDGALARKIGKALIKTHNYGKAINYYEAALKTGAQNHLRYDLSELLLKLRQFDKAEKVAKHALDHEHDNDLSTIIEDTKYYLLLSRIYSKVGQMENSLASLNKAKEKQMRVLKRAQVEQAVVSSQYELAHSICVQIGDYHAQQQRDYRKAVDMYREALTYEENERSMVSLCDMYMMVEELNACQQLATQLLKKNPDNIDANVMMADLLFRKGEYEAATFHFQQLLDKSPEHFDALARLIELCRRVGKLEEVPKFLKKAEGNATSRAHLDAGYNYCYGLYEWYIGEVNNALKHFNKARKDGAWGQKAIINMIEICLNPDNEIVGGEVFSDQLQQSSAADRDSAEQHALKTAERLLRELKVKPGDLKPAILESHYLLATKHKANIEQALGNFMQIINTEQQQGKENVAALLGLATAYMMLKQVPRARNQLKRVAKHSWNFDEADELEKNWLLLSDIYIQSGKYDMATELLRKILQHNKSCCKAYEYVGFIMEKDQAYKDAAENYELAWKYGNKSSPSIGYKLAFNYMKAKRHVDAIDVCMHVLSQHPNYPKIRKEILDKCRQNLRS